MLRHPRKDEAVATDTVFATTKSIEGFTCAQVYLATKSRMIKVYGMHSKSEFPTTYKDFVQDYGIPHTLRRDNANEEDSKAVKNINCEYMITDEYTEPHQSQQNPAEWGAVRYLKRKTQQLMNISNAPDKCWHLCMQYAADIHNHAANRRNK